jgi:heptosyltransferase-2
VLIWDKSGQKYKNLFRLIRNVRNQKYDLVINLQRFANSGLLTVLSGAKETIGFDKNPLSWGFSKKIKHKIQEGVHEVQRNNALIEVFTDNALQRPVLYPSQSDFEKVAQYQVKPYICLAPASVWFTKQFPKEKWIELINFLAFDGHIYLLGAPNDQALCTEIITSSASTSAISLCGQINLLQSAALMKNADMNYVNDSAPMHLASAMNAKTTAIFCSTVPEFGFGPLADGARIVEITEKLDCRPCGLHGFKECPKGHFNCGNQIKIEGLSIK